MQLTLKCDWLIVKLSSVNYIYLQLLLFLIYNAFEKVFQQEIRLLRYEYLQINLSAFHICGEMLIIIYFGTALRLFAVQDAIVFVSSGALNDTEPEDTDDGGVI